MRYLGIDYGAKRVGLAVSDADGHFAFPLKTVPTTDGVSAIRALIAEKGIGAIVIGDSRADNGQENVITKDVEAFAEKVHVETKLPVHAVREAWSSREAQRFAPEGAEHDDAAAAAIILQRHLDAHNSQGPIPDSDEVLS